MKRFVALGLVVFLSTWTSLLESLRAGGSIEPARSPSEAAR